MFIMESRVDFDKNKIYTVDCQWWHKKRSFDKTMRGLYYFQLVFPGILHLERPLRSYKDPEGSLQGVFHWDIIDVS